MDGWRGNQTKVLQEVLAEQKSRLDFGLWIVWNRRTLCRDQGLVTRLIWHPLMTQTRFTKPPSLLSLLGYSWYQSWELIIICCSLASKSDSNVFHIPSLGPCTSQSVISPPPPPSAAMHPVPNCSSTVQSNCLLPGVPTVSWAKDVNSKISTALIYVSIPPRKCVTTFHN